MNYQLKQQVWTWSKTYNINFSNGPLALQVVGKFLSWGDNLLLRDVRGRQVATIKQRMMSLMPTYSLIRNGKPFAEIKKKFGWFESKFELDVPGPNDYTIEGSFWDYEYRFIRSGQVVAHVSKQFWALSDTYGVEIVDGEDDVSILATMIVVDLCCHDRNN